MSGITSSPSTSPDPLVCPDCGAENPPDFSKCAAPSTSPDLRDALERLSADFEHLAAIYGYAPDVTPGVESTWSEVRRHIAALRAAPCSCMEGVNPDKVQPELDPKVTPIGDHMPWCALRAAPVPPREHEQCPDRCGGIVGHAGPHQSSDYEPLTWTGGKPLVPAWCIDHAETEVVYRGHHIPVALPVPTPAETWLRERIEALRIKPMTNGNLPDAAQGYNNALDAALRTALSKEERQP